MRCTSCLKTVKKPTKEGRELQMCGKCRLEKYKSFIEILKEERKV